MAITANAFTLPTPSISVETKAKVGFFARFGAAICASREAAARREIARHKHLIDQVTSLRKPLAVGRDELPF